MTEQLRKSPVLFDALNGDTACLLRLHFLSKSVASDLLILERTRTQFNPGNSMFHNAVSLANGLVHAGTTNDDFIRKNMEWLGAATNWCKYTAISTLGLVYRGHRLQSRHLLSQYLPKPGVTASEYSEAGALFALGLIHAGYSGDTWVIDYLMENLRNGNSEVLQHGCCFGIGSAGIGTRKPEAVEEAKAILFSDSAVAGEGAATALGLLMFGSGDTELVQELLRFARETKHDKITRSLCVAVALIQFGHSESALSTALALCNDQEGWMRFGGVWMLALSYTGTGNRTALQHLLRMAVTDASPDVRRVSVVGMAFVLTGHSTEIPEMVRLLLESYNPNLRFGALLALGIGFAGTGDGSVLEMIDGLLRSDKVDYVRQAAMIAAAMVLMQQSEPTQSPLRQQLERVIGTKHEEALAKFGAVLSQGILDAGGRNQCIALLNSNGLVNPLAVAGMALFCQFWFWYPNANFLVLALHPTALIGVTESVQAPVLSVNCNAKPSLFSYPVPLKGDRETAPVKLVTAVLSTAGAAGATSDNGTVAGPSVGSAEDEKKADKDVEMEPSSFTIPNFTRVTASQTKHVHFDGCRYRPVSRFHPRSITVLIDDKPGEPAEFVELIDPSIAAAAAGNSPKPTASSPQP